MAIISNPFQLDRQKRLRRKDAVRYEDVVLLGGANARDAGNPITPTPTISLTPSITPSITPSNPETLTPTPTIIPSPTPTNTSTSTVTPTQTITQTPTPSLTLGASPTPTASVTASLTPSPTPTNTPLSYPLELTANGTLLDVFIFSPDGHKDTIYFNYLQGGGSSLPAIPPMRVYIDGEYRTQVDFDSTRIGTQFSYVPENSPFINSTVPLQLPTNRILYTGNFTLGNIFFSSGATPTPTPTATITNSPTPNITTTPQATPSNTPSNSVTPTSTFIPIPSQTPTITVTPTKTPLSTVTPTSTPVATNTPTGTIQVTATNTASPTTTPSKTPAITPTPTQTSYTNILTNINQLSTNSVSYQSNGNVVFVRGYYDIDDNGRGPFIFNSTALSADDFGAVVRPINIPSASPGRWIRLFPDNFANVDMWGARGNRANFNDAFAIQKAIDFCSDQGPVNLKFSAKTYNLSSYNNARIGNGSGSGRNVFRFLKALLVIGWYPADRGYNENTRVNLNL